MNIWTDADSSFIAPGSKPPAKKGPIAKKDQRPVDKRLIQVRTQGPFRYDLNRELAHFEKPANQRPGLVEHVTVTRTDRTGGQDLLDCEYLDVQFHRNKAEVAAKGADKRERPGPRKKPSGSNDGDLEVKSIRAWGETVVMTSDSENLHATGSELIHDAETRMTVLKGSPNQQVIAVKEGNLLRGSEMHLYGDDKQISQAHILGTGPLVLANSIHGLANIKSRRPGPIGSFTCAWSKMVSRSMYSHFWAKTASGPCSGTHRPVSCNSSKLSN